APLRLDGWGSFLKASARLGAMKLILSRSIGCVLLAATTFSAAAFSLQGPGGKIVELNEEYRWNVPIVTYSFDQSFVDYFGQAGVQAVQEAIDIFNALPRAARLNIDSYPLNTTRFNIDAAEQNLYDLKSMALS